MFNFDFLTHMESYRILYFVLNEKLKLFSVKSKPLKLRLPACWFRLVVPVDPSAPLPSIT